MKIFFIAVSCSIVLSLVLGNEFRAHRLRAKEVFRQLRPIPSFYNNDHYGYRSAFDKEPPPYYRQFNLGEVRSQEPLLYQEFDVTLDDDFVRENRPYSNKPYEERQRLPAVNFTPQNRRYYAFDSAEEIGNPRIRTRMSPPPRYPPQERKTSGPSSRYPFMNRKLRMLNNGDVYELSSPDQSNYVSLNHCGSLDGLC